MWIMLLHLHVNQKPDDAEDVLLTMELFFYEDSMDPDQMASDEGG